MPDISLEATSLQNANIYDDDDDNPLPSTKRTFLSEPSG
jgi:hypothetical protein